MKKIIFVLLLAVMVIGISAGINRWLKPSAEERRAEVLQILQEGGLIEALSDGQYDDTFLLMELKGKEPEDLMTFVRPIEISIMDKDNNLLAQIVETGILIDRYILTSPALLATPEIQEAVAAGEISIDVKIRPDSKRDDGWKFESIGRIMVGANVVVLEREGALVFPTPVEFPFGLGRIRDLNLGGREDKLYGVGSFPLGGGKSAIHVYQGGVEFTNEDQGIIVISAFTIPSDFGGPVFALRDGEFELLGLVQFGEEGKARVIDIQTILKEIETEFSLRIDIKFE